MKYEDAPFFDLGDPGHRYSEALGVIDHTLDTIIANVRREIAEAANVRVGAVKTIVRTASMRNMILEGLEARGFAVLPTDHELVAKLKALTLLEDGGADEEFDDDGDTA